LRKTVAGLKIRGSGYYDILDARSGTSYGSMIVHPATAGKSVLNEINAEGHTYIRTIV